MKPYMQTHCAIKFHDKAELFCHYHTIVSFGGAYKGEGNFFATL